MSVAVADLVGRVLLARGVDTVYGPSVAGLDSVPVDDPLAARLLADAHRRVTGRTAAWTGDGHLTLGAGGTEVVVLTADDVLAIPDDARIRFDIDAGAPAPDVFPDPSVAARWETVPDGLLEGVRAARHPAALVGPGVVDSGVVGDLRALAVAANLGVLNTWGAKGVFDWRSRHHWATVGLQADDLTLGGLADADLVVTCGLDPLETPGFTAPSVAISPLQLGVLSEHWSRPPDDLPVPALRSRLASVTQRGWETSTAPLPPSRVTLHYGQVLGAGGLVAAEPGTGGYWVARTFATVELGSVQVPAPEEPGAAAARAVVARLARPRRPVLLVADAPLADGVERVRAAGAALGIRIPVEVWDPDGPALDAPAHGERIRRVVSAGDGVTVALATDDRQLGEMLDAAGPVVAWPGLAIA